MYLTVVIQAGQKLVGRAHSDEFAAPRGLYRFDGFGMAMSDEEAPFPSKARHYEAERIRHGKTHSAEDGSGFVLDALIDAGADERSFRSWFSY